MSFGDLVLSEEDGVGEFVEWFGDVVGQETAELTVMEFLRDLGIWITPDGVQLASATSGNAHMTIAWKEIGFLGSHLQMQQHFLTALNEDGRRCGTEDDDEELCADSLGG